MNKYLRSQASKKRNLVLFLLLFSSAALAQVNTALTPAPKFQFISSNGLPLSGGCLFSFVTGTSTPLATYTDATGLTTNADPVVLDANGTANVWLGPQKYRLQLFTAGGIGCSSGAQIWQVDGISGNNLQNNTAISLTAQTAPSCSSSQYILWADSGSNRWRFCNNGVLDTIVGQATTDTLTNKTLTSPSMTNPTMSNATLSGTTTFTGATSLGVTNAGVFTNAQMNDYVTSLIAGASTTTEFTAEQGANSATEAIAGAVKIAVGSTVHQENGIAGYCNGAVASSSNNFCVGGYFQGRATVANAAVWGTNSLAADTTGLSALSIIGNESDVNIAGTPSYVTGFQVNGALSGTFPSAPTPGSGFSTAGSAMVYLATLGSSTSHWPAGIVFTRGVVSGPALQIDATCFTGSCSSATLTMSSNTGSAAITDTLQVDTSGNLKVTMPNAGLNIVNALSSTTAQSAGNPVPLVGVTSQKPETGSADTNVLTVTPPAVIGTYRACVSISVASATAGVISWTLSWTDSSGNAQSNVAQDLFQDGTAAPNTTFTTSAAGNYHMCRELDISSAGANIVVKWVGGGTTAAKVSAIIERLI